MATHSSIYAWRIMDRAAWWATVHGIAKSQGLKQLRAHYVLLVIQHIWGGGGNSPFVLANSHPQRLENWPMISGER